MRPILNGTSVKILTWSFSSIIPPLDWMVQISRCLFMAITSKPSITRSSRSLGSTNKYVLKWMLSLPEQMWHWVLVNYLKLDNCLTILCWFLPFINHRSAIGMPMSPPSHLPAHPIPLDCQSARSELPASYRECPTGCLILHMVIFQSHSQFVPSSFPASTSLLSVSASPLLHCK